MENGMSRANVEYFILLTWFCVFKPDGAGVWTFVGAATCCFVQIVHSAGGSNPTVNTVLECVRGLTEFFSCQMSPVVCVCFSVNLQLVCSQVVKPGRTLPQLASVHGICRAQ